MARARRAGVWHSVEYAATVSTETPEPGTAALALLAQHEPRQVQCLAAWSLSDELCRLALE